jgi:hypothetical protein
MIGLYLYNLLLATSQFFNAALFGDPDESISGRCGRAMFTGKPKWWVPYLGAFINTIFLSILGEDKHIENSVEFDELHRKELWKWYHSD